MASTSAFVSIAPVLAKLPLCRASSVLRTSVFTPVRAAPSSRHVRAAPSVPQRGAAQRGANRWATTMAGGGANGSSKYDYDLFVIGAGSGGVRASRIAAGHGARVAVAEEAALGGTCVNVGCVPKKLFSYGSHYSHDFADAAKYGWSVPEMPTVDWPTLIANKNAEILRLNGIYGRMLENAGVELKVGAATLTGPHSVEVNGVAHTAETILVAVGGEPFVPTFPGSEHVITSNEAFFLESLPRRVLIAGGGYIAVEFACIFHGYGSQVTQLYRGDLFLRGFDHDVRTHLAGEMTDRGIDVRFNTDVKAVVKNADGSFTTTLKDGSTVETDVVMFATGRKPKTSELGLEAAGVTTGKSGEIPVDDFSQTNVPSIYAVGDVTDRVALTPVAIAEGHCFADTLFDNNPRSPNYEYIPSAVFSQPAIGTCGLTEEQAVAQFGEDDVDVFKSAFRPLKHTLTQRPGERELMKLIVRRSTDVVVGVHVVQSAAGELIQLAGVALKAGVTKKLFDSTIGVHPTSAEELVTLRQSERAKAEAAAAAEAKKATA
ncbi:hypothetical protein I4F81_000123 [Pyropia yezoensis]|uniref:Uncharacterized protein n=1 Tax=Pyropia yezoensis TaxID=2788 RepID=A0ACC3BHY4_PYRYE|nr:hypothetical protein I4F81_000123 [Neopyropia yezoensis]|eukprot:contig_9230_g2204